MVDVGMRPLDLGSSAKAYKPFMRDAPPGITDRPISNYKHCFMGLTCSALPLGLNIKYRYTT